MLVMFRGLFCLFLFCFIPSSVFAQPRCFPDFDSFRCTTCSGEPSSDIGDAPTADHREVVGNSEDCAVSYSLADDEYVYLQMRVASDPRQAEQFRSFGWSWGIDADDDGEFEAFVVLVGQGMMDRLEIIDQDAGNGITPTVSYANVGGTYAPGVCDATTETNSYAVARDVPSMLPDGTLDNWTIMVAVPRSDLEAFGVLGTMAVYAGTSSDFSGIDADWVCCDDDGVACDVDTIDVDPVPLGCGNGTIDPGEACDDANLNNGDGCDATCVIEPGSVCIDEPSRCSVCVNSNGGTTPSDIDEGCSADAPFCDAAAAELGDRCLSCLSADHCEDGEECTADTCEAGACVSTSVLDGTACSDGVCNTGECVFCVNSNAGTDLTDVDLGCVDGNPFCAAPAAGSGERCLECVLDEHCDGELVCGDSGLCQPPGGCESDEACGDLVCDLPSEECVVCLDTEDSGVDRGCDASAPVCAGAPASGLPGNLCVPCFDLGDGEVDEGCMGDMPACVGVGASAMCLTCESNADCGGETPFCDPETFDCVACATDAHCDDGVACTVDRCVDATCTSTPSEEGTACPDGYCDGASECSPCLDTAAGMMSSDIDLGCAEGRPFCEEALAGEPRCAECISDANCADDLRCSPLGTCEPGCESDEDCADGVCDPTSFSCVPCLNSEEGVSPDRGCEIDSPLCSGAGGIGTAGDRCVPCEDSGEPVDLGCSAEQPVCDETPATGSVCVECVENRDCSAEEPICNVGTNRCEGCVRDSDCIGAFVCSPDGACVTECESDGDCIARDPSLPVCDIGDCVECVRDAECEPGEVCSGERRCEPSGCSSDIECGGTTPVCDLDEGQCVECLTTDDCESGVCDLEAHLCRPSCDGIDCPASAPICDEGICYPCVENEHCSDAVCSADRECVTCVEDDDCETGVCDTDVGRCVECTDSEDCDAPLVCNDRQRCAECTEDANCPGPEVCQQESGTCVQPGCESDDDCAEPLPFCDVGEGSCEECLVSSHCAGGEVCSPDHICEPRCEASDCPAGQTCHPERGWCVECVDDDECDGDQICNADGACVDGCADDADCMGATPACVDGACYECSSSNLDACTDDAPFCSPEGNVCVTCVVDDDATCSEEPDGTHCLEDGAGHVRCGCRDDADCGEGLVCSIESQRCEPRTDPFDVPGGYSGGATCSAGSKPVGISFVLMAIAMALPRRRRRE